MVWGHRVGSSGWAGASFLTVGMMPLSGSACTCLAPCPLVVSRLVAGTFLGYCGWGELPSRPRGWAARQQLPGVP